MSKLIPKTINGYVSIAIFIGASMMTTYLATIKGDPALWAVVANAGLHAAALVFKGAGVGGAK